MTSKNELHNISRREFMQAGASAAALAMVPGSAWGAPSEPRRDFEYGSPLHEFAYSDVQLAPGPCQTQFEQTHAVLMGLDEDSILRPFRLAAGRPAPGIDLDGWYKSPDWGPATFGQWLSGLSRYYAVTHDEATHAKIKRLVAGFAETIEASGKIYNLMPEFDPISYSYDKYVCGLMDAAKFGGCPEAMDALDKTTNAALQYLPGKAVDFFGPKSGAGESYTVPENQFIVWQRGGDTRHLEMARQYLYDEFYDPLAKGQDVLAKRHAYSHVNCLSSAAKAYLVLGDEKYLKAAANGLAFVEQQSFVTGGWGPSESFLPRPAQDYTDPATGEKKHYPAVELPGDSIANESYQFETPCGSYAHFKVTRYLLRITKNPHYGDSMERVMYNAVLGALPLNKFGKTFYQSNYHSQGHKEYFDGYGSSIECEWPCCSGTLPQVTADYRISSYFRDDDGIFVNLYLPSTLRWQQNGVDVELTQSGAYPLADTVTFKMQTSHPASFAVRLRIPAWAQTPTLRVNGKAAGESVKAGTFATVKRQWQSGDEIELTLPRKLELKAVDSKRPDKVALVSGPIVLFAISDCPPRVTRAQLLAARQQTSGGTEWHAESANGPVRFVPWWVIKDETYETYMNVSA